MSEIQFTVLPGVDYAVGYPEDYSWRKMKRLQRGPNDLRNRPSRGWRRHVRLAKSNLTGGK